MIKMNKKTIIYIIIGILLSGTVFLTGYTKYKNPDELYRVYLSGKTIGYIKSKDELEKYIDLKESEIKKEYNVKNLVLAGGGGKGAYELGVWKALKELSIDKYIDVFSGTSIGAFNAALFAQDDLEKAVELWDKVTMDSLVPIRKFNLVKKGIAL